MRAASLGMASPERRLDPRPVRATPCTVLLLGVLGIYFVLAERVAMVRPLWHDEVYTVAFCRLPTMGDVWRALASGVDQTAPLGYVFIRLAHALAPDSVWALRLPSIIGFALLPLVLFLMLRRRVPPFYALAGALVPFATQALHFSWEARSYAVALGFEGLALLAWELAGDPGPRRRWAVAGLALASAAAVSCHYAAVLIVFPLALGELVRSLERGRFVPALWAALAAPVVPLAFFFPLMRGARTYSVFWAQPSLRTLPDAYSYLVGMASPLFIGLGILWLGWLVLGRSPRLELRGLRPGLAVAAGFLMLPAVGVAGSFLSGGFTPRYVIWAVPGLALTLAYVTAATAGSSVVLGRVLAVSLVVAALAILITGWRKWATNDEITAQLARAERISAAGLPVVFASPLPYVPFAWYARNLVAQRVSYLVSPKGALRYIGTDTTERSLEWLAPRMGFSVAAAGPFLQANRRFYLISGGDLDWLMPALLANGATVVVKEPPLFEVTLGPDAVASLTKSTQ